MKTSGISVAWQAFKAFLQLLFGFPFAITFCIYPILHLTNYNQARENGTGTLVVSLVFGVVGIILTVLAIRTFALLARFSRYRSAAAMIPEPTVESLAKTMLEDTDRVRENVRRMIRRGMIVGFLEEAEQSPAKEPPVEFSVANEPAKEQETFAPPTAAMSASGGGQSGARVSVEKITVTCPYCRGVSIVVKGSSAPCDYCRRTIQG